LFKNINQGKGGLTELFVLIFTGEKEKNGYVAKRLEI
jgi:hypothetical protein